VGPRGGLDAVAMRKKLYLFRESNAGRPGRGLFTLLTELPSHGEVINRDP